MTNNPKSGGDLLGMFSPKPAASVSQGDPKKPRFISMEEYFKNGYALVVDDVPNMCKSIRSMLKTVGVKHVVAANDGDAALSILRNPKHSKLLASGCEEGIPCLFMLLDWYMPHMSGIEVTQEIRADETLEGIPVLMITGESRQDQVIQAAAEAGVNGFILKPFVAKDLENKMMAVIQQRANPPEHVKLIKVSEKLLKERRFDEALDLLTRAMELCPNSARLHVLRGEAFKGRGRYDDARASYGQAMMHNPKYLKTWMVMADLALIEGNKDQALSSLKKAAEISPCNADRHTAIGKIYLENGDAEEAKKAFDETVRQDPKKTKDIAEAYLAQGSAEKAEEYFRKSMPKDLQNLNAQQKKDYVHTANRLGIALRRQGKLEEAVEEYQKARKLAPEDEAIYFNLGKAYVSLSTKGNAFEYREKAVKCFRKAVELDKNFEEAKEELKKLGDTGAASEE